MKKLLALLVLLLTVSCGSYFNTTPRVNIAKVLVITSKGDTVAVPMRDFQKRSYDYYRRFDADYIRNRWEYPQLFYPWQFNNGPFIPNNGGNYYVPNNPSYRPIPQPKPKPRPQPRPRNVPQPRIAPANPQPAPVPLNPPVNKTRIKQ